VALRVHPYVFFQIWEVAISNRTIRLGLLALMIAAAGGVVSDASAQGALGKFGLSGDVRLTIGDSGKCIAIAGGAKMGNQFHAWKCRANSSLQAFQLKQMQQGLYQIRSKRDGMCLDVSGSATKVGAPVVQWRCKSKSNANQLWQVLPGAGGKSFLLKARHSGKCLQLNNPDEKVSRFVQQDCAARNPAQNFLVWN